MLFEPFKSVTMSKLLLRNLCWLVLLASCASSGKQQNAHSNSIPPNIVQQADTTQTAWLDSISTQHPLSLMDLPESQDGDYILANGFYEAEFKSYCLQPGTPSPSSADAYLMAPLGGYRRDIVETVLRNSLRKPHLDQRNIQLLLWSVVSGSNFNKLSYEVQGTAFQLLSPKQIFELKGGVMGVVKTVAAVLPESGLSGAYHDMNQLFELGASSYEAYERIAVLRQPSVITRVNYKKDQWYKQPEGYYVRYFPNSYQHVKIQVYVPEGLVDSTGKSNGEYLLFDPVSLMAVPANSNAQRLGIGAPVVDILRKVIEIEKRRPAPNPPPRKPAGDPKTRKIG